MKHFKRIYTRDLPTHENKEGASATTSFSQEAAALVNRKKKARINFTDS